MQEHDNHLNITHDEAYASMNGEDVCEDCDCEICECYAPDEPDEPDFEIDEDVCFGGVDW